MKLHLGCGERLWEGFTNVDLHDQTTNFPRPDVVADIRALPFDDESAEEAHAIHVIEHFYEWEAETVLREWKRVLKPGGRLVLELPSLDKVFAYIAFCLNKKQAMKIQMTLWPIYGDHGWKSPAMCHKWGYTRNTMAELMQKVGFKEIQFQEPKFHVPERDMRVEARKQDA